MTTPVGFAVKGRVVMVVDGRAENVIFAAMSSNFWITWYFDDAARTSSTGGHTGIRVDIRRRLWMYVSTAVAFAKPYVFSLIIFSVAVSWSIANDNLREVQHQICASPYEVEEEEFCSDKVIAATLEHVVTESSPGHVIYVKCLGPSP
jgi:hypothetical protein